jgi:GntR family transcriptional regulator
VRITLDDGLPIYQQIINQVKHQVASGRLAPGEELPPIRVLAEQLRINPNTVVRAYRELEAAGVIEKRGTVGTYVSEAACPLARRERLRILSARADALVVEARQLGVGVDEVLELVRKRDRALDEGEKGEKR